MISREFIKDNDKPIVLGFCGRAGSGKTSVAENIVPKGSINIYKHDMKWDHIFFALPLYELASIKKNIMGYNQDSRQLYAIHEVLYDLFGASPIGNVPSYDQLVEMVHNIHEMHIEPEGTKPRTFLQNAGDICRDFDQDCFTKWALKKSNQIYKNYIKEFNNENEEQLEDPNKMIVIISDVRFYNEAQLILNHPNGVLVYFDASEETLRERILKRDGKPMSEKQLSHKSESDIVSLKQIANFVINSDNMTIEDQANNTLLNLGLKTKEETNA